MEVSLVSIPADYTVGVGRAYSESNPAPQPKEKTMDETKKETVQQETLERVQDAKPEVRVEVRPDKRATEIAELGKPIAVYSTPMTRTMDDKEREKDVPKSLTAFPDDHWATVARGEAFVGVFKAERLNYLTLDDDDLKRARDACWFAIANHNTPDNHNRDSAQ